MSGYSSTLPILIYSLPLSVWVYGAILRKVAAALLLLIYHTPIQILQIRATVPKWPVKLDVACTLPVAGSWFWESIYTYTHGDRDEILMSIIPPSLEPVQSR